MDLPEDAPQAQTPDAGRSPIEAAQLEKLKVETDLLRRQLHTSPPWVERVKALAGATGVVTAMVAVAGFMFTFYQWRQAEEQRQAVALSGQFGGALENLVSEQAGRRVVGAVVLRRFLEPEHASWHEQALASLTSLLPIEPSPVVRDEILSTIREIPTGTVEEGVLREAVRSLADASRSLVREGDLERTRTRGGADLDSLGGVEARAQSVGYAIVQLVRAGAREPDLASIYCLRCDFSSLDLGGASFDNSILYLSDFGRARLDSASFDGADLEGTTFVNASLRGARFTFVQDDRPGYYRSTYINRIFWRSRDRQFEIFGPDFTCADLRGADFSGFPVFGFTAADADIRPGAPALVMFESSFVGADLAGASFEKARIFGSARRDGALPFQAGAGSRTIGESQGYDLFEYGVADGAAAGPGPPAEYHGSLQSFQASFAGSNWREARLPPQIGSWLARNAPPPTAPGTAPKCERLQR